MKYFVVFAMVLAAAVALPRTKRQTSPFAYALPSNTSVIVGNIDTGFDCTGLQYGYYADDNNNCQIFHVCLPYVDSEGFQLMRHWSFLCGIGTIFDQSKLVCEIPEYALPCSEARNAYSINDYFREENEDREFRDGLNDFF